LALELKPKKVLLVGDRRRARVEALAEQLRAALASRLEVTAVDLDDELDLTRASADLVLVLGGDGSILRTAHRLGENAIPLLGVNLGKLGFLATVSADEPVEKIAQRAAGPLAIESRSQLSVSLVRKGGERIAAGDALNDAVLDRGQGARLLTLGIRLDGRLAFETRGDGILVSTPTGSTAYSLAAGGPVLHPGLDVFLVTPICPHSLTNRPVVVQGSSTIEIEIQDCDDAPRLSIDGETPKAPPLRVGDRIEARRSQRSILLAVLPKDDFYTRLRNKLHFGRPAKG
jgi:NAD+ kinase